MRISGSDDWFEQYGHPVGRLVRALCPIAVSHSWPLSQTHQTFFPLPTVNIFGERSPFLVGCHCLAKVGFKTSKLLSEPIFWPEQYGQPLLLLFFIIDSHSWPLSQIHQAFIPEPWVNFSGLNPVFLLWFHCFKRVLDSETFLSMT